MNITITGSLGHISKPLTQELVEKGHSVTVISSNPERQKEIEVLGARAAIGSVEDVVFLKSAFTGTDAVYGMLPPPNLFDPDFDLAAQYQEIANNYAQTIQQTSVQNTVFLSSVGAHTNKGNGFLRWAYVAENILNQLPPDVAITFMRPVGFYYNLFAFINTIKTQGAIISNYGGDDKEPWVSPSDIAAAVAEEMVIRQPAERKIRYVASDEVSPNEAAHILGTAIGKPDLKWVVIPDEQRLNGLTAVGMNPTIAKDLTEMDAGKRGGMVLYEDYYRNRPALGSVKMNDFAKKFAAAFKKA
jgi:uncharacterized protein YbjT (DUF2867 family)